MIRALQNFIERQILKARGQGKLQGLKGEGRPLPARGPETGSDAALSAGMRLMAEAGVLPEEFSLKKQLDAARAASALSGPHEDRRAAQARIADLEMRYNMAREARRAFFR